MIDTTKVADPENGRCNSYICKRTATVEGFSLLYRLFDAAVEEEDGKESRCFHLEITMTGVPEELLQEEIQKTVLLEDISRDERQAVALTALLAEESVMPCSAFEVMEDLLSYGELPEELLFGGPRSGCP